MRIGFFDSGIGGLTVLHQTLRFLPNEDYLFYADTRHVPYGEKRRKKLESTLLVPWILLLVKMLKHWLLLVIQPPVS